MEENTTTDLELVENPPAEFEVLPYPNRDGKTWGWRWHNTSNNRDVGPTFPTMKKARAWLNENSATAVTQTNDVDSTEEKEFTEDHELEYETEPDFIEDNTVSEDE